MSILIGDRKPVFPLVSNVGIEKLIQRLGSDESRFYFFKWE